MWSFDGATRRETEAHVPQSEARSRGKILVTTQMNGRDELFWAAQLDWGTTDQRAYRFTLLGTL